MAREIFSRPPNHPVFNQLESNFVFAAKWRLIKSVRFVGMWRRLEYAFLDASLAASTRSNDGSRVN